MVERVECLPSELQRLPLGKLESLEERKVVVVEAGQGEFGVVAVVADVAAAGGPLEHGRVEPLVDAAVAARKNRVTGLHVRAAGLAAAGEVETVGSPAAHVRDEAGRECRGALKLPAIEHLFCDLAGHQTARAGN